VILAIAMRNKRINITKLDKYFFCVIVWCFASVLWSISEERALAKCWTLVQMFAYARILFEFFSCRVKAVKEIVQAYFVSGFAMCLYALSYYGVDDISNALFANYRMGNEINQINIFGMTAAFTVIMGLYLSRESKKKKYFLCAILPFIMALTSGSTKALAILIFGFLIVYYEKIKRSYLATIAGSGIMFLCLIVLLQDGNELQIVKRFGETLNVFTGGGVENTSSLTRIYYIKLGWNSFLESPLCGKGLGNFAEILFQTLGYATYAHNNYIEVLVDLGIIGFALYYSIYFILLKKMYLKSRKNTFFFLLLLLRLILDIGVVSYYSKETYIFLILFSLISMDDNKTGSEDMCKWKK
jgi:O-antigen ligase